MPGRARRVLVVGIDGVRLDTLRRLPTPHLDALARQGFLAPVAIDAETPTMSGPCWATIVTGVTAAKHGVWSNDFSGHRLGVFPDFATRLAEGDGRRTFVAAGWEPLMLARGGGPLFRAPARTAYVSPCAHTPEGWEKCDEQITEEAVRVLSGDDPEASFVYLGAPDETAHFLGCGSEYDRSVLAADERLGRLLEAVRSRPSYEHEDWTYLVVTDHGHVDAGGHGGRSEAERTAWLIAAGPGIDAGRAPVPSAMSTWHPRCSPRSAGTPTATGRWTAGPSPQPRTPCSSTWTAPSSTPRPCGCGPSGRPRKGSATNWASRTCRSCSDERWRTPPPTSTRSPAPAAARIPWRRNSTRPSLPPSSARPKYCPEPSNSSTC